MTYDKNVLCLISLFYMEETGNFSLIRLMPYKYIIVRKNNDDHYQSRSTKKPCSIVIIYFAAVTLIDIIKSVCLFY